MAVRPGSRTGCRSRISEGSLASRSVVRYGAGLGQLQIHITRSDTTFMYFPIGKHVEQEVNNSTTIVFRLLSTYTQPSAGRRFRHYQLY